MGGDRGSDTGDRVMYVREVVVVFERGKEEEKIKALLRSFPPR